MDGLRTPFILLFLIPIILTPAFAAERYEEQVNHLENTVPITEYRWDRDVIQACIFKENSVPNSYYVWTKLAVQDWRQALREYTGDQDSWNINARFVPTEAQMEREYCDVRIYIYDSYKDFPDYPEQTGAYTSVNYNNDIVKTAYVYLSPTVLHGDGHTDIDLPSYAFRNSADHEIGHVLGLGHMATSDGYLMSPLFDFWKNDDQLPITMLELRALIQIYGTDGFD